MNNLHAVKIVNQDDNTITLGGYGVIFGGADLVGETFTPETNFRLKHAVGAPLHIDHTLDTFTTIDGKSVKIEGIGEEVGEITAVSPDDVGLYMEAMISKANSYWPIVEGMVNTGKMGFSTGSNHTNRKTDEGVIKYWPITELSLTLTPAEPRTVGTAEIKTAEGEAEGFEPLTQSVESTQDSTQSEVLEMTEEVKAAEAQTLKVELPEFDYEAVAGAMRNVIREELEKEVKTISQPVSDGGTAKAAPAILSGPLGDTEANAFKAFTMGKNGTEFTVKASNATDMNIGTAADGGNAVPTGFYNQIIARRDETSLRNQLPLMRVPGIGTTVDVPLDAEADGEFIVTGEAATFDEDSPAIGKKSLTLAKYTKYLDISYELLEDTPTAIESFLADFVGRGMAKTDNNLLLTEVATNGTNLKTFAAVDAIAFGEPEDMVYNDDLSDYMEDDGALHWVTRASTYGSIRSIVGNDRQYGINVDEGRTLLGYPVHYSQKAPAMSATNKSIYFGNWRYVAYREAPELTFLRDPYTVAVSGQVRLLWHYRIVFGVLQAEAIGYGTQAAS